MIGDLQIRRAAHGEASAAFQLVEEYNAAVGVTVRDTWDSFLQDYLGKGSGIWLAHVQGTLAGCIALRPLRAMDGAGEVKRLYVRPSVRGGGIAAALLAALEAHARDTGYAWLYLDSKDDLVAAIRFYHKHGYTDCERYNANPQATVFMRKPIGG